VNCSTNIDECENVTCSGRGECIDRTNGFVCRCNSSFFGDLCEKVVDACNPNPCLNGGTCTKEGQPFQCTCTGRFQGKNCEEEKPKRTFLVTVTITERTYDSAYDDINSPRSRALIVEITAILESFCRRTFRFFVAIRIIRFFRGSVGVDFDLVFEPTSNVTNNSIVEEFQTANGTEELEFLFLGKLSAREVVPTTPTVTTVTTLPTATESSKLETWIIVLIVASIVALILVVVIIILVVMYKREKTTGKEMIASDGYWELQADIKDKPLRAQYANGHRPNVTPMNGKVDDLVNESHL